MGCAVDFKKKIIDFSEKCHEMLPPSSEIDHIFYNHEKNMDFITDFMSLLENHKAVISPSDDGIGVQVSVDGRENVLEDYFFSWADFKKDPKRRGYWVKSR